MSDLRPFHWLSFAVLLFCGITLALPNADAARQDEEHVESPLAMQMDALNSNMKKLRRALKDPAKMDECLTMVREAQGHAIASMEHAPPAPDDVPAEKHPAWTIGFKRQLLGLADSLLELELALMEGRAEDAQALVATALEFKSAGHDEYQR